MSQENKDGMAKEWALLLKLWNFEHQLDLGKEDTSSSTRTGPRNGGQDNQRGAEKKTTSRSLEEKTTSNIFMEKCNGLNILEMIV